MGDIGLDERIWPMNSDSLSIYHFFKACFQLNKAYKKEVHIINVQVAEFLQEHGCASILNKENQVIITTQRSPE